MDNYLASRVKTLHKPADGFAAIPWALPDDIVQQLQIFSTENKCSVHQALLAGFSLLLYRYGSEDEVEVQVDAAHPWRITIETATSFVELLAQIADTAVSHDQPSAQFTFQNIAARYLPTLPILADTLDKKSPPLDPETTVMVLEPAGSGDHGLLLYHSDLFDSATIDRLIGHLQQLLSQAIAYPHRSLATLPILTEAENILLLNEWNDTKSYHYPSLHALFEAQVERNPNATAITFEHSLISYAELNRQANQLAHTLLQLGLASKQRVAILLEDGPQQVAALLGVLKAGGLFICLDANYPTNRLQTILEEAQPIFFVTENGYLHQHQALLPHLPEHNTLLIMDELTTDQPLLVSGTGPAQISAARDTNPNLAIMPTDPCYIVYTSGSTGKPKGIQQSHLSFCQFIDWQSRYFNIVAPQRFAQWASIAYDAAYCEIFGALCFGATLCMAPALQRFNPQSLISWARQERITILQIVPSFCRQLLDELRAEPRQNNQHLLPALEKLLLAGEILPVDLAHTWQTAFPDPPPIYNLYGPSETILATYHAVPLLSKDERAISVGRAIAGRQILILDRNKQLVPVGITGEIYIRSQYLTDGYIERPAEMAAKFMQNPLHDDYPDRVYRTGDMGRWLAEGQIEFYGRQDNLVKLRGMRVELGDIENSLRKINAITNCAVIVRVVPRNKEALIVKEREVRESLTRDQQVLVAYYSAARPLPGTECRAFLEKLLPPHMIPQHFVQLEALPFNANRKLDINALPAPENRRPDLTVPYLAPRNPLELQIVDIWQSLLGIDRVGVEDGFFELGGDSLLAMQVLNRIREATGHKISFRNIFERQTVAKLAALVASLATDEAQATQTIPAASGQNYPLSLAQHGIWFLWKLEPDSPYYTAQGIIHLQGKLNIAALQKAWQSLIDRHVILRVRFDTDPDGLPIQIFENREMPLPFTDLTHLPANDRRATMEKLMWHKGQKALDLERDNLFQGQLFKLADNSFEIPITFHEITLDLWGWSNIMQDLGQLYGSFVAGENTPPPPLQFDFADYVLWENATQTHETLKPQEMYWREQLSGELPILNLPTDRPYPVTPTYRGAAHTVMLDPLLTAQLRSLSQQHNGTLFMTILTAFNILLHVYAGQDDFIIGAPIANRTHEGAEELAGFFLNMLPLRTRFQNAQTFSSLLEQVRGVVTGAISHAEYPFSWMLEWADVQRDVTVSPVFQVMFNMLNLPHTSLQLAELEIAFSELDTGYIKYDLALYAQEQGDEIFLQLAYLTDLFDSETAERMLRNLVVILRHAVAQPHSPVSALSIINAHERRQLLHAFNDTNQPWDMSRTISTLFENQVARTPTAVAFHFSEGAISYAELNQKANQLAHFLRKNDVDASHIVALCVDRSLEMIVSLLGIIKSGAAYVALDPTYPIQRLQEIIDGTQPSLLLQQAEDQFPGFTGSKLFLESATNLLQEQPTTNPAPVTTIKDLFNIVFTSASSGKPKGVRIAMSAVLNRLHWMWAEYPFIPGDTAVLQKSYALVAATWELFGGLLQGVPTLILKQEEVLAPELLWQAVKRHGVSHLLSSPALIEGVLQMAAHDADGWPSLRLATTSAEAIPPAMVYRWREVFPDVPLLNLFGASECASNVTQYDTRHLPPGVTRVPIGRPLPNTQVFVLNDQLRPVPIGVTGEMCVAGMCLAESYLNLPEMTAQRFISWAATPDEPPIRLYRTGDLARWRSDGNLELIGRRDFQVKIRGFRVELNDVEAAIMHHKYVKKCAVTVVEPDTPHRRLAAYIVTGEEALSIAELRDFLRQRLPGYMVPADFMLLPVLPLTPTGKIDRKQLPAPPSMRPELTVSYVAPQTHIEQTLAEIWAEMLGREKIGVHDNFFDLGGHSLLATQVVSRIRNRLKVEFAQRSFFESPTIAEQARLIAQQQVNSGASQIDKQMADLLSELEALSDAEAEALLAQVIETDPDNDNQH